MTDLVKIYGLLAILALTLALANVVNAMVPPVDQFQPARCGNTEVTLAQENRVLRVCLGQFIGHASASSDQGVRIDLNDSEPALFRVVESATDLIAFENGERITKLYLEAEKGTTALVKITRSKKGELLRAEGQYDGESFFVPKFENVFTVQ